MASRRSWSVYPTTYRAREARILADWIRAGESGSLIGLAGAGKSNLLGFLAHRPDVFQSYVQDVLLVLVDLNNLPGRDQATFYRVVLRSLYEAQAQLATLEPGLTEPIEVLYRKVEDSTDPFLSHSALREALILFREADLRLVFVFDPFDRFCKEATEQLLDNLRGLRDSFKANLSYLVGLRRELIYLREAAEMGELYELLDTHQCWLGAMEPDDARWVIHQMEEATEQSLAEEEAQWIVDVTGAYPALLRAASLWVADYHRPTPILQPAEGPSDPKMQTQIEALLNYPAVRNRLEELWQGLSGEERKALSRLQLSQDRHEAQSYQETSQKYGQDFSHLQEKGICTLTPLGGQWQFFSPLFQAYVGQKGKVSGGRIWHRKTNDQILQGDEMLELSAQSRKLLLFFLEKPPVIIKHDEIFEALWPDDQLDEGIKPWETARVHKAVSDLRRALEPGQDSAKYIVNERKIGYRFFPEGAPP